MTMTSKTYPCAVAAAICAKIEAQGGPKIDRTVPSGDIKTHGCDLTYLIADREITITLVHKPGLMPASLVWSKLDELFGAA
jgi:hypothetical protein